MRCRSVMSPLRTGCSPTWKATSSTASMANIVFLLSRGIPASVLAPVVSGLSCRPRGNPRRAEAATSAVRSAEFLDLGPDSPRVTRHDKLCNSHAARDAEWLLPEVDQDHADLAAIVGIDGSGRIGDRDAVLGGQARPGPDLGLKAHGQGDRNPRRDNLPVHRCQLDILVDGGQQVGAGGGGRGVIWKRQVVPVRQANDFDLDRLDTSHGWLLRGLHGTRT